MSKIKISNKSKIKIHVWEKHLEISQMYVFVFWTQFGAKESFRRAVGVGGAFNENNIFELMNSFFYFHYFHSKVLELRKISYDFTIWLNSVLWRHNP